MPDCVVPMPWGGVLAIRVKDGALLSIDFLDAGTGLHAPEHPVACQVRDAVHGYLSCQHQSWPSIVRYPQGSMFQQRVWAAIAAIPVGQTRSYGELARQLDSSARAVGRACGDNPWPLLVPCHRVVAANGLGGFNHDRGDGMLAIKRWLLVHEQGKRQAELF